MSIRLPNSCFVHIPRTGGLWLGEVVSALGLRKQVFKGDVDSHFTYSELPEFWKQFSAFSIVRNPLDWVKSRWSHALEIGAYEDHRHFGIHRVFDECVRPTFEETIKTVLQHRPGLVGETYSVMTAGVRFLIRTEDFPDSVWMVLSQLEELQEDSEEAIRNIHRINSTSKIPAYRKQIELTIKRNPSLIREFEESERLAIDLWNGARLPLQVQPKGAIE